MQKKILLVAAKMGYQTRVFAEAGARLGFDVQLATDRCHQLTNPWGDDAIAVDFANPQPFRGTFDGIVAVGDKPAEIASLLAEANGLRFHSVASTLAARNKFLAHERFAATPGMLVPQYRRLRFDEAATFTPPWFPCVVKPLCLSASRGVIRANNMVEFREAASRIQRILAGERDASMELQVEEFIHGREFAVEGLMTDGGLQIFAIFDKPDPLDGPFFEETIYVTPSKSLSQYRIKEAAERAVNALGLSHGPVHIEMRVNDMGVWILEAAARPIGGLCGKVLRTASGKPWEEVILRHAAGIDDGSRERLRSGESAVLMIPIPRRGLYRGVSGLEEATAVAGIEHLEITAKEGQEMVPLPEGSSYLGFIFAHAVLPGEAEAAVRKAHTKLTFDLVESLPLAK